MGVTQKCELRVSFKALKLNQLINGNKVCRQAHQEGIDQNLLAKQIYEQNLQRIPMKEFIRMFNLILIQNGLFLSHFRRTLLFKVIIKNRKAFHNFFVS